MAPCFIAATGTGVDITAIQIGRGWVWPVTSSGWGGGAKSPNVRNTLTLERLTYSALGAASGIRPNSDEAAWHL